MSSDHQSPRFLERPEGVRLLLRLLYGTCAVLLVIELLVHRHAEHPWEHLFAFHAVYGFSACVLLVLLAKQMRKLVMRAEDYYERDRDG